MTNAAKFKGIFGMYATELWSKSYKEFSDWLNKDVPETNVGRMISKQAVIDEIEYELEMINSALDSMTLDFNAMEMLRQRKGEAREILNSIQTLPSVQRKGKWIKVRPIGGGKEAYMCPFCRSGDWDISVDSYNYCPYCGESVSGVLDDPSHPFADDVTDGRRGRWMT